MSTIPGNLQGYFRWIQKCNGGLKAKERYHPWSVGQSTVGYLQPWLFQKLKGEFPNVFKVLTKAEALDGLALDDQLSTCEDRSAALEAVVARLRDDGVLSGWRNELYPVLTAFDSEPLALVERAAAVHLGIKAYGVHVNGYVETDKGIELWVATRSKSKPTWPGRLDHIVAGGQPHGLSPQANVVKECGEEASIPEDLARNAKPVGAVSYEEMQEMGLKRDVLFCYDLKLPPDFVPEPQDGEVESFQRLPIEEVANIIATTDKFKDNCNLVIIDFLIRHGFLKPEQEGYLQLLAGLRWGPCT
ncbi:Nudix hydrolase 20, chloroplastic [Coccomyxa sp. Obi]|nr:Nudix hydrolase 20, chloroplastic [Coccomyxa sp. Obi]